VANLEEVARRLVGWCGLDWEPGCLAFHEGKWPVRTASVTQVRQPIYQRSVARWRHYEKSLGPLFDRLEDGLAGARRPAGFRGAGKARATARFPTAATSRSARPVRSEAPISGPGTSCARPPRSCQDFA
jgi:hypothetical protein